MVKVDLLISYAINLMDMHTFFLLCFVLMAYLKDELNWFSVNTMGCPHKAMIYNYSSMPLFIIVFRTWKIDYVLQNTNGMQSHIHNLFFRTSKDRVYSTWKYKVL